MYEQCLWTSDMLSKIAGQWSASLILHDSTRVFRTLGYCRLARFLCKLNIGRKRVNITSNLDSSYTYLTGIKETINHCKKELHIWSCRRPKNPPLGAWLWKNYSVTLKNFYLQLCWGSTNLFSRQTSYRGVHRAIANMYKWRHNHVTLKTQTLKSLPTSCYYDLRNKKKKRTEKMNHTFW